jgi:hypothetical protein
MGKIRFLKENGMKKLVTVLVVLLLATSLFAQGGSESKSSAGAVLNFKLAENQPQTTPFQRVC